MKNFDYQIIKIHFQGIFPEQILGKNPNE